MVNEKNTSKEAVSRLARVGYENVLGYLDGGISTWIENGRKTEIIKNITADDFIYKINNWNRNKQY